MGSLSTSTVAEIHRAASHVAPPRDGSLSRRAQLLTRLSLAPPLIGFGAGGLLLAIGSRERRSLGLLTLSGAVGLGLLRWQLERWVTESAQYTVESGFDGFEIRNYAPTVRAETTVRSKPWSDAVGEGFGRLASYVFGDNATRTSFAMTTPVLATIGSSSVCDRVVSFIMPARYALAELPVPLDSRVVLRVAPGRRVAALRFSGRYAGDLPAMKRSELLERVRRAELSAVGEVLFAGYDAPSTLPFLRRNEVLVEVL